MKMLMKFSSPAIKGSKNYKQQSPIISFSALCPAVFTKEELILALMPVFELVWNQDPESFPFRQPVDPKALGIPVS